MLCPRCGNESKQGLCVNCFSSVNPIKLKKLELSVCNCGKYKYRGLWKLNLEKSLEKIVKNNLLIPDGMKIREVEAKSRKLEDKILVEIKVECLYNQEKFSQEISEEIDIKKEICQKCKRLSTHNAVIQFRGFEPGFKIKPEFLSEVRKTRDGLDFYITKKEYARKIAKKLQKRGFLIKESQKLIGLEKNGKRKSRLTISIRKLEK